ncbi:TonB-dependent receptor plug domain-containing protein [Chitinophaga rhizophila]|uniref:TonB-dependent receptor plug domain-containing protein n=1 Tax=Chitinophaga rhizophila TaxID=2866212 RepID=A0ABS7G7L3_9BACT|nr:TonB-dependent receptor plug domain-containing protein [Chitinophaga rhizophila]MBW8683386.1 TonB-dependent receptor plug domain-containing protein [Chitinophaga rhizophila]
MIRYIQYCSLLILTFLIFGGRTMAQLADYNNNKEKIYIQTNHIFLKPGEDLFYKIYLVNARTQYISVLSNVVYVEIVSPSGAIVEKQHYHIEDGAAEGSYHFSNDANGGIYKIRAYTAWMMNEKDATWFSKDITLQKVIAPRVLMKLDFPRKGYGPGDEVTAMYSMRSSLNDLPVGNYECKFTVSVGGQLIESNKFKTDIHGKANVRFRLPAGLATNDGLLNINVVFGGYTEAISRSIPITLNKIDLQFMPEGGTLVNGLPTNIAFKALNEFGKPVDVKGQILDQRNNVITTFNSYHDGMGQFNLTPEAGKLYKAKLSLPTGITQAYDLPTAAAQGVVMNIRKKGQLLELDISTTRDAKVRLIGSSRHQTYFRKELTLRKGRQLVTIDPTDFPAGIAKFTLTTEQRLPLAERLVFLHTDRVLNVKITADKTYYQPREKVKLRIKTQDENGQPLASNLSLTVVDDKLWSLADDKQDHILSWLLMSSELHGKIEEPQFYFKHDEKTALPALDLVMLTHGYRYFDYIDHIEKTGKPKYHPDLNNVVTGIVLNEDNQPVKAKVYLLSSMQAGQFSNGKVIEHSTGEDGVFFFGDINPALNYHLIARSEHRKQKIKLKLAKQGTEYVPRPVRNIRDPFDNEDALPRPMLALKETIDKPANVSKEKAENAIIKDFNLSNFDPNGLQEVVVTGYYSESKKKLLSSVAIIEANQMIPANDPLVALQGSVAGIGITKNTGNGQATVKIRGMNSISGDQPLIILDGIPIERLENINSADIHSIEVLKDASATALFGSRGTHGVILITSVRNSYIKSIINLEPTYYYASEAVQQQNSTFTVAARFYAPKYLSPETKERTDFRETIYWNPIIHTNNQGEATIEFYNSDATTTFRAISEGISYNGKPGRAELTYSVRSPWNIDVKIPPYLTTGDLVSMPLVIRNNTQQPMQAKIKIAMIEGMLLEKYPDSITVPADSTVQILITAKAFKPAEGKFTFSVTNGKHTEQLSLPVKITANGFPVITTIAGNRSLEKTFTISNMMEGTLVTDLKVFRSLEGQLLNDIASMLREPHGCFEQTSSSTYPNIFILKYLRAKGVQNIAVEQRALEYINAGYKRLIGYETTEHGFEWFGNTPPHEALTAYGLMEFTDMMEFVAVDKAMLERTRKFLLSRRDGKGTFRIRQRGYDAFASVPDKLANIYIVYALTQAGIKEEIQFEYKTAVAKVLESNDTYELSMMALAAHNMGATEDFRKLLQAAKNAKLQSSTTVVNSRANSLRIETMALYAMALMRQSSPDIAEISGIISRILAEKSYYGYGSTQATVLALQALVAYEKLVGTSIDASQLNILINNKAIYEGQALIGSISNIREGDNKFSISYKDEKSNVPYQLELSYYTSLPPSDPKAEMKLATKLSEISVTVGETVRMQIQVTNSQDILQPMTIAKIGIPAGLTVQPWQLKEIMEKGQIAFYEIFDNYLVLYWMGFAPQEAKQVHLDLKAEIAGKYKGKASTTYLYYTPEFKHWNAGTEITIEK